MFINSEKYNWTTDTQNNVKITYKGDKNFVFDVLSHSHAPEEMSHLFKGLNRYSSGVIETNDYIIAWVDHIRSWPLFYAHQNEVFLISPDAYKIKEQMSLSSFNPESLVEFKLSGYVTGKETLIDNLFCLNPGEYLIWNKKNKNLHIEKYFSYIPSFDSPITTKESISRQNALFDHLTKRIIDNAAGRAIWIPLSGGLDSRILLCKLHEHGYTNIQTFTYGPRFNFEAIVAKKIAKKLNTPWRFVHVPRKIQKQYFNDKNRKSFFQFSGNFKAIPCMREYSSIRYMHENGEIDKDAIFLNGQSGDYITGGHISQASRDNPAYNLESFYDIIINKHYDLWKQHKTASHLKIIKEKIYRFINDISGKDLKINSPLDGAKFEEMWEYEGRQICYVVNGQRVYEYFGYNWEMPLWEKDFVDFYQPLPYDMKYDQKIYKDYLHTYNYKGLFPKKDRYIWRWPIPMLWVLPAAQIIGFLAGRKAKDAFYAKMRYWGHYANQYAFFDMAEHYKTSQSARSIISLYVPIWFKDHEEDFE